MSGWENVDWCFLVSRIRRCPRRRNGHICGRMVTAKCMEVRKELLATKGLACCRTAARVGHMATRSRSLLKEKRGHFQLHSRIWGEFICPRLARISTNCCFQTNPAISTSSLSICVADRICSVALSCWRGLPLASWHSRPGPLAWQYVHLSIASDSRWDQTST